MFYCEDCEAVFSEPDGEKDYHPYGMGYAAESYAVCPYCRSTDISEAKECERCGEYFGELYEGLCDVCYEDMYGKE